MNRAECGGAGRRRWEVIGALAGRGRVGLDKHGPKISLGIDPSSGAFQMADTKPFNQPLPKVAIGRPPPALLGP